MVGSDYCLSYKKDYLKLKKGDLKMFIRLILSLILIVVISLSLNTSIFILSVMASETSSSSQCNYSLRPTSNVMTLSGGSGSFDISVSRANNLSDIDMTKYQSLANINDKFNNYKPLLDKTSKNGSVRVIVRLNDSFVPEGNLSSPSLVSKQRESINKMQSKLLSELSGNVVKGLKRFQFIPFISFETDQKGLSTIYSSPNVTGVYEDKISRPFLSQSVPIIQGNQAWNSGYTGSGQTIAILDTGIETSHPFFSGKIVYEACYSTNSDNSLSLCPNGQNEQIGTGAGADCQASIQGCGHGTHVAGIAGGKGTSFSGVAKDANIMAFQVFTRFDDDSSCDGNAPCALSYDSDQIKALEKIYSLRNTFNISSVNMSLGGGKYTSNCDTENPGVKTAIDNLRSAGIATIIASGNESHTDGIGSPACISTAISVGSTTKSDVVSDFSNSASFLHLLAPGSKINSSVQNGSFGSKSGTSMATPHVAGAWAILTQKNPDASVSQILQAFQNTGTPITDHRNGIVKPRINIKSALDSFDVNCPWTATSNNNWINITDGQSGTGHGQTSYAVLASTSNRIGTISVQGQQFTVIQSNASFADVSRNNTFHDYIHAMYVQGITVGCEQQPLKYCPTSQVTRGQMAAFIIRAKFGEDFKKTETPHFTDVPNGHNFFKYIQKLKDEGFTTVSGSYNPDQIVPREQMSAFIGRAFIGMK